MAANDLSSRSYQAFAEKVRRRDRFTCRICGELGARTVDHVVPRHLGGAVRSLSNTRTLCKTCNLIKGGSMMTDAEVLAARRLVGPATGRTLLSQPRNATIFGTRARVQR